jgi:hypothetical protein
VVIAGLDRSEVDAIVGCSISALTIGLPLLGQPKLRRLPTCWCWADLSDDRFEQLRLRPVAADVALYEQDARAGISAGADGRRLVKLELLYEIEQQAVSSASTAVPSIFAAQRSLGRDQLQQS